MTNDIKYIRQEVIKIDKLSIGGDGIYNYNKIYYNVNLHIISLEFKHSQQFYS